MKQSAQKSSSPDINPRVFRCKSARIASLKNELEKYDSDWIHKLHDEWEKIMNESGYGCIEFTPKFKIYDTAEDLGAANTYTVGFQRDALAHEPKVINGLLRLAAAQILAKSACSAKHKFETLLVKCFKDFEVPTYLAKKWRSEQKVKSK